MKIRELIERKDDAKGMVDTRGNSHSERYVIVQNRTGVRYSLTDNAFDDFRDALSFVKKGSRNTDHAIWDQKLNELVLVDNDGKPYTHSS